MSPACCNAIRQLHALLQQVAAEVAAIRPLLEEEAESRSEVVRVLNARIVAGNDCPATAAADTDAACRADWWKGEMSTAIEELSALANLTDALDLVAPQAGIADWMLTNRSSVFELSGDDDSRVYALVDAARSAIPNARPYILDATARAVLALPADVAYPVVEVANG